MYQIQKYKPYPVIALHDREWPNKVLTHAPIWCSVDLRDGNQALPVPMNVEQKLTFFKTLVACGFKEIEVGFPAASPTEYEFVRHLIDEQLIPEDVTIQVLVQARSELIEKTFESIVGAKKVIVHLYNSTSPAQRRVVFGLGKPEIVRIATTAATLIKKLSQELKGTEVVFEYSPESFSSTEIDFSLEICEAVMDIWQPTVDDKMIINLPGTVEASMPNVYADQIEWFCKNMKRRNHAIVSVHTHNDRGTGIAATELGLLAGAERVEGTLFGNGERTGNLDIVTVALNLFTQGIDPRLDFFNIESIRTVYEECTGMTIHPRHPYAGDLVFTAFSGSHQDAIRKGLKERSENPISTWDVPYLTISPPDVGRKYEEVIRVNGQSGKGGIAYLLEQEHGIHMPKDMVREFGAIAGIKIDALSREVTSHDLKEMLWGEYIERAFPYTLKNYSCTTDSGTTTCKAVITNGNNTLDLIGEGNGPIDAFIKALNNNAVIQTQVLDQAEHALGKGSGACAISYIQLKFSNEAIRWGAGVDTNIELASIKAIVSALNRQ